MAASPKALYNTLPTTSFRASEEPTSQAKSHHVDGEVHVEIDDGAAVIPLLPLARHAEMRSGTGKDLI
jgi:hypothetical protein